MSHNKSPVFFWEFRMRIRLIAVGFLIASVLMIGYSPPDALANDHEIYYYEGEPYWYVAEYAGKVPMVSGGTLYVPTHRSAPKTAGDRVIDNATTGAVTAIESGINNSIDRLIYDLSNRIFKY